MLNNKSGNSIALILLVILFAASFTLYSSHITPDINLDKTNLEEVNTEVEIATKRAIDFGINDFLENGFSNQNKVWYCNYPYPAGIEEAEESLEYFVEKRLNSYFELLRKEGYEIQSPAIQTNFNKENLESSILSIELNDLIVGIEDTELTFTQKFDKEYNYDNDVFKLYLEMFNWIEDNHGKITNRIYEDVLFNVPCQAVSSSCQCLEGGLLSNADKESLQLKIEDVIPALNASIKELNKEFVGTDVTCSYEIEKYRIENTPKVEYEYSLVSYLQESSDILNWDTQKYDYNYVHYLDDYTLPAPGSDALGGCPTDDISQDGTYRETNSNIDTFLKETPENNEPVEESCTNSDVLIQKNELYAVDKSLGLLLEIKCQNNAVTIETKNGIEPLSANIRTRIAVKLECPIPDKEELAQDPAYTCGGGGGGGAIVTGTIGCDFANECSECEQCIIDESEPDGYTCLPEPEGVPCSGVCTACDGNGECNQPVLAGAPDDCGGDCMVCDGVNIGTSACAAAAGELYNEAFNLACDGTCLLCDENAQCERVPEDFSIVDSSFCPACQTCGESGASAACVANPEDNGEFVKGEECKVCMDGNTVLAVAGSIDKDDCKKCEVCSQAGECEFVEEFSTQNYVSKSCGKCKTCSEENGDATCIADIAQNGNNCGNKGCSVCTDGNCGGSTDTLGNLCSNNYECETRCDINGKCVDASQTQGDVCSKIFGDTFGQCVTSGTCSDKGQCIGGLEPGTQCCGDLICPSGSPCCPNGGGLGIWTCEACDDGTT